MYQFQSKKKATIKYTWFNSVAVCVCVCADQYIFPIVILVFNEQINFFLYCVQKIRVCITAKCSSQTKTKCVMDRRGQFEAMSTYSVYANALVYWIFSFAVWILVVCGVCILFLFCLRLSKRDRIRYLSFWFCAPFHMFTQCNSVFQFLYFFFSVFTVCCLYCDRTSLYLCHTIIIMQ